ncbi:MAG: NAD(+)/NADH kinase [Fusobacterium sp.]|nr:NAD(+)/NADH kinase [Fusobacterium sp.]
MKPAIIYNPEIPAAPEVKDELKEILNSHEIECEILDINNMKKGFDIAFVIGGDGTILKTARFFADTETAIFGINLGRLGFLSQSSKEDFTKSLEKILNGEYRIENRLMLATENQIALNDFVIKTTETGRTARLQLKINGKEVCNYLADGIIISTPTGSTAYGLSAGGPVLSPDIEAFVIVPICPHTLNARPLVVPTTEEISISSACDEQEFILSVDGQGNYKLKNEIKIKKSELKAKLLILDGTEFYNILKTKLNWSVTPNYC